MNSTATTDEKTLEQTCKDLGITAKVEQDYDETAKGWRLGTNHWRIKLAYQGRTMSLWYYTGQGLKDKPQVHDVIYSLLSDEYYAGLTLDDFIYETGTKIESVENFRELERMHKLMVKQNKGLKRLIGSDETLAELNLRMENF